ncbi:transcription factor MYB1R1-like [Solanum tuberosum]|uniref:Myb family transcription factor n=1 Tax=Solanum tuberosum TaxID=4113 RepID=M1DC73_SOLTU|nr:PREDICTED: transcription factor MYB1R1-like [Solanum tuberosum]
MTKETIKLFGVEISVNNVSSSVEESTSDKGGMSRSCKGKRWSEDEQRAFLIGLDKLGKGNWTQIAKEFVPSRTPTQVASHAQKYFDRQKEKRALKRNKSSVFDINLDQESSNTCPELVSKRALKDNKKKGKQVLNEESPISPMPISYRLPPNGSYGYCYVPMNNYQFNFVSSSTNATPVVHRASSQSSSASLDNIDLTL